MKLTTIVALLALIVVGCARDPLAVSYFSDEPHKLKTAADEWAGPYRLWGEFDIIIDESHSKADIVPKRQPRFHLNALKFLESGYVNFLKITGLKNNGDGTIDLTVQITHPFPGLPQFTGFDVKGIIMFEGSYLFNSTDWTWPLYPEKLRAAWRILGDPELLNADGYTYRWSPWHNSGSDLPIFNYWHGKYATGTPTANINGFLNFYSMEERHIFEHDASVSRTYHIALPPGPLVAGYAVEACWEPPLVKPVTNPIEDFPITANQPECYRFKVVVNDGNPITEDDIYNCCNYGPFYDTSVHGVRLELDYWYLSADPYEFYGKYRYDTGNNIWNFHSGPTYPDDMCDGATENWKCVSGDSYWKEGSGIYLFIGLEWHHYYKYPDLPPLSVAIDLYEVVVELE